MQTDENLNEPTGEAPLDATVRLGFADLIEGGCEFELMQTGQGFFVQVSVDQKNSKAINKRPDWKHIKRWATSLDFQRFIRPKIFSLISERPVRGQLSIFDA